MSGWRAGWAARAVVVLSLCAPGVVGCSLARGSLGPGRDAGTDGAITPMDLGIDTGPGDVDTGVDAGTDAFVPPDDTGTDVGPPDMGPPDVGPPDMGPPDMGPPDMGQDGGCPPIPPPGSTAVVTIDPISTPRPGGMIRVQYSGFSGVGDWIELSVPCTDPTAAPTFAYTPGTPTGVVDLFPPGWLTPGAYEVRGLYGSPAFVVQTKVNVTLGP